MTKQNADKRETQYTFSGAIGAQSKALYDRADAYSRADKEIRAIHRRQDLYEGEKARRIAAVKSHMQQEIGNADRALRHAQQEARRLARPATATPDTNTVQRLAHYRQEANDAMRGRSASVAVALARKAVQDGDPERARAYVEAVRPLVENEGEWKAQWMALNRATEPKADRIERDLTRVCQAMEQRVALGLDLSDAHIANGVGQVHPDVRSGVSAEQPLDVRKISFLARDLPQLTADAVRSVAESSEAEGPADGGE